MKREYWITSEAESVYSHAKMLVSMEMHSPIIFIVEHKPAILLRQAEDTWKGQMWRDLDMQDWILELNVSSSELIDQRVDNRPLSGVAEKSASRSGKGSRDQSSGMEQIRGILDRI